MIIHKDQEHIRVIAGNQTIHRNIDEQGYALATGTDGVSYYLTKRDEDLIATPMAEVELIMDAVYTH